MDPACVSSACVVDKGKWPNTISVYNEHEGKINLTMSQATITCDRLSVNIYLKEKSQRKGLKENCFFRKLSNLNWSFKGLKKKKLYRCEGIRSLEWNLWAVASAWLCQSCTAEAFSGQSSWCLIAFTDVWKGTVWVLSDGWDEPYHPSWTWPPAVPTAYNHDQS